MLKSKLIVVALVTFKFFMAPLSAQAHVDPDTYQPQEGEKCVQIFYDQKPDLPREDPHAFFGEIHSIFLQNLIGHFPHIQQLLIPVEKYRSGMIERCKSNIYLGTYFNNHLSDEFINDFLTTKQNFVWAGYNIWTIPAEKLKELWRVAYLKQTALDFEHRDPLGRPGFFKFYRYKDELFEKFGAWNKDKSKFLCQFEITQFEFDRAEVNPYVLAWASHSTVPGQELPYILRNANRWFIGDSPFSFATESDRYLIMADLLFDVLDEKPLYREKKPALFRIEDINGHQDKWQLLRILGMLKRKGIPYTVALIPVYSDPAGRANEHPNTFSPLGQELAHLSIVNEMKSAKASFVMHGVTHQLGNKINPHNAISGDDFEFWDAVGNKPIVYDDPSWVIDRVQTGYAFLEAQRIPVAAWEVPHYQASPLDYTLFGQLFDWNLGRITYFPHKKIVWTRLSESHAVNITGTKENALRMENLRNFEVTYPTHLLPNGQFYPYESYGDIYDQRVIPENVGNFQPFQSSQVPTPRTVNDLLAIVKRNRNLRDVWASCFMHSHLLETSYREGLGRYPGDTSELERYIDEVQKAGYEFVSLKDFVKNHRRPKRNPTIRF